MLVPRSRQDEVLRALAARRGHDGDKLGPSLVGAVGSGVQDYIRRGAGRRRLVAGGSGAARRVQSATSCARRSSRTSPPDMAIAQEEIFGPVLAVMPYDDEDGRAADRQHTVYGLAGGVWSGDRRAGRRRSRADAHRPGSEASTARASTR
jgi:aldehyde dehydrogenase (NAD+)